LAIFLGKIGAFGNLLWKFTETYLGKSVSIRNNFSLGFGNFPWKPTKCHRISFRQGMVWLSDYLIDTIE